MNTAECRRVGNRTTTRSATTRLPKPTRSLRQDQRDSRGDLHLAKDEADARNGDQVDVTGTVGADGRGRARRAPTRMLRLGTWHGGVSIETPVQDSGAPCAGYIGSCDTPDAYPKAGDLVDRLFLRGVWTCRSSDVNGWAGLSFDRRTHPARLPCRRREPARHTPSPGRRRRTPASPGCAGRS